MCVDSRLVEHRDVWRRKPVLRALYGDYYRRMLNALPPEGPYLEIGAGSGNMRESVGNLVSLDILPSPWIDVVGDAQTLPFAGDRFAGILMLDVLHHLARPLDFFSEARRVLRPGGRIVMIEPGITPLSWLFYRFLHQEPVDLSVDPMQPLPPEIEHDPFAANQAIPTLLFARAGNRQSFARHFPDLSLRRREWLSLLAYPLSGGFKSWSLIPTCAARPLLAFEAAAMPLLGPLMAFRLAIVLERT